MVEVSFDHQVAIDGFLAEAKKWCLDLVVKEKLRKQPFSDTVLHEVAVRMPSTVAELEKITGIDPVMAKSYGTYLLRLVGNVKELCGEISQADERRNGIGAAWPSSSGATSKPFDPNHEVYVISDDDDEHVVSDSDKESKAVEKSRFFGGDDGPAALDPAVADFNNMIGGTASSSRRRAEAGVHAEDVRQGRRPPQGAVGSFFAGGDGGRDGARREQEEGRGGRQWVQCGRDRHDADVEVVVIAELAGSCRLRFMISELTWNDAQGPRF